MDSTEAAKITARVVAGLPGAPEHPVMRYRTGYKYQLAQDVRVVVHRKMPQVEARFYGFRRALVAGQPQVVLTIREGYAWDGPSGPAIDTEGFMLASAVHDVFCQATDVGEVPYDPWRQYGDELLAKLLRYNMGEGQGRFRRWWAQKRAAYAYRAVRWYSERNRKRRAAVKVVEAPAYGSI